MIKKKRLLWQLYPSYLFIILVSLTAAIWFASRTIKTFILEHNISNLKTIAHMFEVQFKGYLSTPDLSLIDQLCKRIGERGQLRVTVMLPSGVVAGDSEKDPEKMDSHLDRPEVVQAFKGEVGVSTRYSLTLRKDMTYVAVPLKTQAGIIGVIRTGMPSTPIEQTLQDIQIKILMAGVLIAILAAIIFLFLSRRITRPIEEIKKVAESFARGEFKYRVPVFDSKEMGSLSEIMNQIAKELHERINTITQQRNELEAVFSSMIEGVLAVDAEEHIISMNHAAAQIFQCDPNEVQGRSIEEAIRNVDLQRFVKDVLSSRQLVAQDILLYSTDERILNGHGTVLCDAEGKGIGALVVLNDVTRLRRLENIRRDFVANVSHEIKTPITAIKGFVQTLRDGAVKDPENRDRFLEIIEKHIDRLTSIIEDLLSLSRIEEGTEKEEIVLHSGSIRDVLRTATQLCGAKAAAKNIRVELSCDPDLRGNINPALLEQAVINLLDNAIKYSGEQNTIHVVARQEEKEIVIEVRDEGCGIEKRHLARLFERFYRVDKARSRKLGGTGLGLAIVKHITQAHGGHVTVDSSPGRGSTFSIHLPVP